MASLENTATLDFRYGIKTFPDFISGHAKSDPNRIALNYYGREVTFKELDDCSRRLATAIANLGYQKGERLAVLLQSCPQCVITYLAALQLGLIIVPIDPMSKGFELEHYLTDSDASLLITMDSLYTMVSSLENRGSVKDIIVTSFQDFLLDEPRIPLPPLMQEPVVSCDGALQKCPSLKFEMSCQ